MRFLVAREWDELRRRAMKVLGFGAGRGKMVGHSGRPRRKLNEEDFVGCGPVCACDWGSCGGAGCGGAESLGPKEEAQK
ncbi:hypothetical protein [Candidatus Korobacter versatilis]|uniref:hypothetical protein n=1 Tax=Candidatus Korobacter versatilis TaxID=658062 RepID=UPI000315FC40|nr:hypothetical protein [Candidatus Koribacter versatilis]